MLVFTGFFFTKKKWEGWMEVGRRWEHNHCTSDFQERARGKHKYHQTAPGSPEQYNRATQWALETAALFEANGKQDGRNKNNVMHLRWFFSTFGHSQILLGQLRNTFAFPSPPTSNFSFNLMFCSHTGPSITWLEPDDFPFAYLFSSLGIVSWK